jgi:DNA-binding CsgD family transcriptional regulator
VINLRRNGLSFAQIGDIVGMSAKMVERYCRNADMRSNSRAALSILSGRWRARCTQLHDDRA